MSRIRILLLIAVMSMTGLTYAQDGHQHHHHMQADSAWPSEKVSSQQLLTAEFELLNGDNKTVTEQNFRGQYLLISFGFSHCKHVCPTILRDWAQTVKKMPASKAEKLQAIMISLDPERDSPEQMDQYSKLFNPGFVGLSGSIQQVTQAASNFRVTFHKAPIGDEDYQINHTSLSYLVDPQGKVIDYFGFGTPSQQLAEKISAHIP